MLEEERKAAGELGVVGDESDEAYIEAIQVMEVRDCKGRRA